MLTEVVEGQSKSAHSFCIQIEASLVLATARMRQQLHDQACALLQRALTLLQGHVPQHEDLRQVLQQWRCAVLYQLGVLYDGPLNRHAHMGETCWRDLLVVQYSTGDSCSCAHVRHCCLHLNKISRILRWCGRHAWRPCRCLLVSPGVYGSGGCSVHVHMRRLPMLQRTGKHLRKALAR